MSTLVTGSAGFIGYHVADRLLARGDSVIGIDSLNDYYSPQLKHDRVADLRTRHPGCFHFEKVDFSDEKALEKAVRPLAFDRIIHLGAQAGVRHSIENPRAYERSNLAGHLNLLEIARERRSTHLVYASSSSVYGKNKRLPFSVEDRVDNPVSLYAATKRADELMSEAYSHLYRIPLTGLRFFTVYGPWGRPDMAIWDFTAKILAGQPIQVFNQGNMRRDFTYVDDAVTGVIASHDRPPTDDGKEKSGGSRAPHEIFNLGNNRSETLTKAIEILEAACGRKANVELLPMQPGDVIETFADISTSRRKLGFNPATLLEEGIPQFVSWYKDYHRK
jgi:UDP-glucuronate 4-epimerase